MVVVRNEMIEGDIDAMENKYEFCFKSKCGYSFKPS